MARVGHSPARFPSQSFALWTAQGHGSGDRETILQPAERGTRSGQGQCNGACRRQKMWQESEEAQWKPMLREDWRRCFYSEWRKQLAMRDGIVCSATARGTGLRPGRLQGRLRRRQAPNPGFVAKGGYGKTTDRSPNSGQRSATYSAESRGSTRDSQRFCSSEKAAEAPEKQCDGARRRTRRSIKTER